MTWLERVLARAQARCGIAEGVTYDREEIRRIQAALTRRVILRLVVTSVAVCVGFLALQTAAEQGDLHLAVPAQTATQLLGILLVAFGALCAAVVWGQRWIGLGILDAPDPAAALARRYRAFDLGAGVAMPALTFAIAFVAGSICFLDGVLIAAVGGMLSSFSATSMSNAEYYVRHDGDAGARALCCASWLAQAVVVGLVGVIAVACAIAIALTGVC